MWVRLSGWMIADREPPLPAPGDLLKGVGVRARTRQISPAVSDLDGVEEVIAETDQPEDALYVITGEPSDVRDYDMDDGRGPRHAGAECVIDTGVGAFHIQFAGWARDLPSGSRVSVRSTLAIIGDYEWEEFGLRDTRADWIVRDVVPLDDGAAMLRLVPSP